MNRLDPFDGEEEEEESDMTVLEQQQPKAPPTLIPVVEKVSVAFSNLSVTFSNFNVKFSNLGKVCVTFSNLVDLTVLNRMNI